VQRLDAGATPAGDAAPIRERILVADRERQAIRALTACLKAAGYEVLTASTATETLEAAAVQRIDAILIELTLPDLGGIEVCWRIREWSGVPLIVLAAGDDQDSKISALDAGADDYVAKPFAAGELLARLRAVVRRRRPTHEERAPRVAFGEVEVDLAHREVRRGGRRVHLTPLEYGLLAELCRHANRAVTHSRLLETVWGRAYVEATHYLYVYMASLRRKLEHDPARPRHLLTESGVGYRLCL
jgi:two-component system, OmpR family, KDP operon response regulator KdpE